MNTVVIKNVIDLVVKGENNCVLIDGPWGVGKTYQINECVKKYKKNKKVKFAYVSLFGTNSIDEIHTRLYQQLHPNKHIAKNCINLIPAAIAFMPYVGNVVGGLENVLGGSKKIANLMDKDLTKDVIALGEKISVSEHGNKSIKSKNVQIVILDDLERKAEELTFDIILGYINTLMFQGIKVVLVCDKSNISDQVGLNKFKEKVIEREFCLATISTDAIDSYCKDLTYIQIDLLDNNIRTLKKSLKFYCEIYEKVNNSKYINIEELLTNCILVVKSLSYIDDIEKEQPSTEQLVEDIRINKATGSAYLASKLKLIKHTHHDIAWNQELLIALLSVYYYCDYLRVDEFYTPIVEGELSNILLEECYFQDTKGKQDLLKKQYEFIRDHNAYFSDQGIKRIGEFYKYKNILTNIIDFNELEEFMIDASVQKPDAIDKISLYLQFQFNGQRLDEFVEFEKRLRFESKALLNEAKIKELNNYFEQDDYENLCKSFSHMDGDQSFNDSCCLNEIQYKNLLNHNYFLPKLNETISLSEWQFAHLIVSIINKEKKRGIEFDKYLRNTYLEYKEDCTVLERLKIISTKNSNVFDDAYWE